MAAQQSEEERARRKKAMDDLPPLPPLLAQILAEARAKQEKKANGGAAGEGDAGDGGQAKPASGPLFLEAAPNQLIAGGQQPAEPPSPRDSDSEEDESEAEAARPPGDLDASRCRAHGPGFSGGAAGAPVKLTITARDSSGKRIKTGGAHVLVMVEPVAAPGAVEEPEPIQAEVQDHGNGNYTASYAVPSKGNYEVRFSTGDEVGKGRGQPGWQPVL
jgi:arginine/serine-rich splicing factor 12